MAKNTILNIIIGLKDNASGGLKTIGSTLKTAFSSAPMRGLKTAIVGIGTALVGAVVEGAKFNVEMSRVWTMAGGGISTFKKLREEARNLSSTFGIARSEMAKGMYNALSAGVDKAGLESFMSTAAKVAVADGSEISVAVDGITTVLNAFKIQASDTAAVADDMFQTVSMGKTTFRDLAANLATVAPMAAASNIPLKQILAHVAALTAQGTPTAQAMTQIRASIMGLNKALGDGWSKNMSYQDALEKVWKKAKGSQTALLELVGSSEAVQAVLGGVGKNAQMADEKLAGMSNTAGTLETAFKKVDQFRHWAPLLESTRSVLSQLGGEIDSRLRPFVLKITEQIQSWSKDKGLWSSIGSFLDKAAGKLESVWKQVGDIVGQIKSVDDLKVVAEVIGDWIKDKLLEGGRLAAALLAEYAPIIGKAIGEGIKEAATAVAQNKTDRVVAKQQLKQRGQWEDYGGQAYLPEKVKEIDARNNAKIDQYAEEMQRAGLASKGQALRDQILKPSTAPGAGASGTELAAAQGASNESLGALLSATLEQHRIVKEALAAQERANEVLKRQVANNRG